MIGFLVLNDQAVFPGRWVGEETWNGVGEVVFNTSMIGYQEILTDPSYFQQIIVMTTPEIGNYGVAENERESRKIWAEGLVCVELNESSDQRRGSLKCELARDQRPALTEIDTRKLTLHLRTRGTPWGAMVQADSEEQAKSKAMRLISERKAQLDSDWVFATSAPEMQVFKGQKPKTRIAILDLGAKSNIIRELQSRVAEVAVFNSRAAMRSILDWEPNGVMLTNGPGDPADVKSSTETVRGLLGKVPIFGICMGHQILALAAGGKTYKLKFGHRGANHPVQNLATGEIYMTSQNHGYAVNPDLPSGVKASQINLYDKTIEGIEIKSKRAWSVQYHPEASPGPHDSRVLFDYFVNQVAT